LGRIGQPHRLFLSAVYHYDIGFCSESGTLSGNVIEADHVRFFFAQTSSGRTLHVGGLHREAGDKKIVQAALFAAFRHLF
jgi:hypothetical protein